MLPSNSIDDAAAAKNRIVEVTLKGVHERHVAGENVNGCGVREARLQERHRRRPAPTLVLTCSEKSVKHAGQFTF